MAGSVIVRGETTITSDGMIEHDDQPITWEDADARVGRRLDRRRSWAFVEGGLCRSVSWTAACSGCGYGFDSRGSGCHECGHHGVVREAMWVPESVQGAVAGTNRKKLAQSLQVRATCKENGETLP
jgi:hypothetical protein